MCCDWILKWYFTNLNLIYRWIRNQIFCISILPLDPPFPPHPKTRLYNTCTLPYSIISIKGLYENNVSCVVCSGRKWRGVVEGMIGYTPHSTLHHHFPPSLLSLPGWPCHGIPGQACPHISPHLGLPHISHNMQGTWLNIIKMIWLGFSTGCLKKRKLHCRECWICAGVNLK